MIYALGTATAVFILSLVKSPVVSAQEDHASGRDFSIVVMTRMIGTLIGTPLITAIWVQGVAAGGAQLGLPFFVASVCAPYSVLCLRMADYWSDPVFGGSDHNLEPPRTMEQVNARELGCISAYLHSRETACPSLGFCHGHNWLTAVLTQGVDQRSQQAGLR